MKVILSLFILLILGIGLVFVETNYLAVNRLTVRNEEITDQRFPQEPVFHIAYISDFHYNQFMNQEKLDKVIETINSYAVDVILFGGDLISDLDNHPLSSEQQSELIQGLDQLQAPLGKFAILGDGDLESEYTKTLASSILVKADFELLDNQNITLVNKNQQPVLRLLGVNQNGDASFLSELTQSFDESTFTVLLSHKASQLSLVDRTAIDLVLAGHTHGGQINLPFFRDEFVGLEIHTEPTQTFGTTRIDISNGVSQRIRNQRLFSNPQISIYSFKYQP